MALGVSGGRRGLLSSDTVKSAIGRPYSGYHLRIERKAAALLHAVACSHGFADGNKRTAILLVDLLLGKSGYELDLHHDQELEDAVLDAVDGRMGYDDLVVWFRNRIARAP